ncbi:MULTISPECIES: FAD-dependent oxidoreductase [unclassified Lysinibacillus]|jgi:sarcosine oxidase subunit alpha|uniref:NAD(P)/FAD-dependent oxidoreductase n=1 Tax=unclassified Lysinibacillus TaxID=2636778 RepID=UPI0008909222|nr:MULTISPECIES: FAD-dependent oxidoreductase [unclassified Lysinibacillus]WCH47394.1 NAD(P)/FAD-dependent oxidoreductase [Lysinibacillus sp. OF-1]SCY96912.1 sarcosine oxidase subunit alpha [Lysinibacillus sp. SG9]SDB46024.1 sarcosine oxidase subunit alpha [Lysinibacillus sp. TC-37]SFT11658.1 sarcosine oxidase subunit alpha [Lysinibacillus sp. SG55]
MNNKVIIIGAGPAGLAAAITLAEKNIAVLVIDEYLYAGGRLLGQLYEEKPGTWWNGIVESERLLKRAKAVNVEFLLQTSVSDLEKVDQTWIIHTTKGIFRTQHLLLATGAAESPFPIPGWTLPGVMSVGAAQVMTNVHRVKPGKRGVIVGVNVLSSAIAMELQLAGVQVAAITLPPSNLLAKKNSNPLEVMNSLLHVAHMAPSPLVKMGSKLMKNDFMKKLGISFYPKNGVKMWDIPIMLRKAVIEIVGKDQVEGVVLATVNTDGSLVKGSEQRIKADFICIAGGLYPLAELASLAGCPFHYIEELGGFIPLHNEQMETNLEGLYVAGNITGIEGAKVALAQGKVAGLTIAQRLNAGASKYDIKLAIQDVEKTRATAHIQFHPEISAGRQQMKQIWDESVGPLTIH